MTKTKWNTLSFYRNSLLIFFFYSLFLKFKSLLYFSLLLSISHPQNHINCDELMRLLNTSKQFLYWTFVILLNIYLEIFIFRYILNYLSNFFPQTKVKEIWDVTFLH